MKLECLSYPRVEISETPVARVLYSRKNCFGFMDVAVTPERVYALYSGKTFQADRQQAFECNRLLEYDWEGNFIRSLEFKASLTGITYDREEGRLYGKPEFVIILTRLLFILSIAMTVCSCCRDTQNGPMLVDVNSALKLSGENRGELQKVLDYYRTEKSDPENHGTVKTGY